MLLIILGQFSGVFILINNKSIDKNLIAFNSPVDHSVFYLNDGGKFNGIIDNISTENDANNISKCWRFVTKLNGRCVKWVTIDFIEIMLCHVRIIYDYCERNICLFCGFKMACLRDYHSIFQLSLLARLLFVALSFFFCSFAIFFSFSFSVFSISLTVCECLCTAHTAGSYRRFNIITSAPEKWRFAFWYSIGD